MKKLQILLLIIGLNSTIYAQNPFFPQFNSETETWHYIDINGNIVLEIELEDIEDMQSFSDGLAATLDSKSHLWGYINTKGVWQIQPTYEVADEFKDGYAITANTCVKCNETQAGTLDDYVGYIIDKTGKVLLTDNSQDEEPSDRYSFNSNLGSGLFSVNFGDGFGENMNYINLKGQFMCKTYAVNTRYGDLLYDQEIQAIRCKNIYYNAKGQPVLDLSKYSYLKTFSEGKIWGSLDEEVNGEFKIWSILIDKNGKEIRRFDGDSIQYPMPVKNGKFTYENENFEKFQYNLATNKSTPYEPKGLELNYEVIVGPYQANGSRFILDADTHAVLGFENKEGMIFYKKSE